MRVALALVLSAAYGAGAQFLGARVSGWGLDIAQLSAPWLLIAFLAGATQKTPGRAALIGLGSTAAALAGYGLMTDSPLEGAHYTLANAQGFVVSNSFWFVGALITGPLFGWFGQQWRTRRAIVGALVIAAAFCLEAVVRRAAGLALAATVLVQHRRALRPRA